MLKAWNRLCAVLLAAFCAALPVRASIPRHSPDAAAVALLAAPDQAERVEEWLIRDPLGEAGGINLTAFCGNDPINQVDPLGLACTPWGKYGEWRSEMAEALQKWASEHGHHWLAGLGGLLATDAEFLKGLDLQIVAESAGEDVAGYEEAGVGKLDAWVLGIGRYAFPLNWYISGVEVVDGASLGPRDLGRHYSEFEKAWKRVGFVSETALMLLITARGGSARGEPPTATCTASKNTPGSYRPPGELPRGENGEVVPSSEYPHTQLGTETSRRVGEYTAAREWGANGQPLRDIHFTDHGRPTVPGHINPHQHQHIPNPTGGTPQYGPAEPFTW
jgi:hypothetical protein